jgi:hypothetical protein
MNKPLLLLLMLLTLGSCATHNGIMTGNAQLEGTDFELVKLAIGNARTVKFLGIGGLSSKSLVFDAKKDLYRSYPLKRGQAYANVSVDFRRLYVLIYTRTDVTVTADIVNYNGYQGDTNQAIFDQENYQGDANQAIFDQVHYRSSQTGLMSSFKGLAPQDSVIWWLETSETEQAIIRGIFRGHDGMVYTDLEVFGEIIPYIPIETLFLNSGKVKNNSGEAIEIGGQARLMVARKGLDIGTEVQIKGKRKNKVLIRTNLNGSAYYVSVNANNLEPLRTNPNYF